ncbi:MAG TPA: chromate transporter [Bacilli bacterium]|jgi:chromate transporter|nr:chromate transporter [Bacilli bacterium]HPY79497.1 chromate transporter [Bacilli bacterium]HQA55565.1 chromate transporter [Bacilli bacterium]
MIFFELFYVFFLIGLFTFGGGYGMIPLIQEQVVARGWIEYANLTDFVAISESTPGPFAINIATFVGSQMGGVFGAMCATLGVVLPSFIIILIIAVVISRFMKNRFVRGALSGVRPIVLGLISGTAIVFLLKLVIYSTSPYYYSLVSTYRPSLTIFVMLFTFYLAYRKIKKKSPHPIIILGISALLGIIAFYLI